MSLTIKENHRVHRSKRATELSLEMGKEVFLFGQPSNVETQAYRVSSNLILPA